MALVPVEEGRPAHSNLENFSRLTEEGVTIDQTGRNPDFVARTYDDRSGSANPNRTVYMLATENVINAYTPQMQMEEGDAGPDLPDNPRRTLVLTNQNGDEIEGALFIDPSEGKIVLVTTMDEFDLTMHYGRNGMVETSYRPIPPAGPARIAGGFLKERGSRGYVETGVYIFDVLAAERRAAFPGDTTVNGMMLKITALQSLEGGEYTGHLNLFLGDLAFENVVVGEELKILPYTHVDEKVKRDIQSAVTPVENRVTKLEEGGGGGSIDPQTAKNTAAIATNKKNIEGLQGTAFDMLLTSPTSLTEVPAVGASFTITMLIQGAAHSVPNLSLIHI